MFILNFFRSNRKEIHSGLPTRAKVTGLDYTPGEHPEYSIWFKRENGDYDVCYVPKYVWEREQHLFQREQELRDIIANFLDD